MVFIRTPNMKTSIYRFTLLGIFAFLILVLFSFPDLGKPSGVGLDSSWVFAINYFFANGIQFGKDVIFTFGPLGFLVRPEALSYNLEISLISICLMKFSFIFTMLNMTFYVNQKSKVHKGFSFFVAMVFFILLENDLLPFFMSLLLVLCHYETKKNKYAIFAAVVASISLLIKINIGLAPALVVGMYSVFSDVKEKKIRMIPTLLFCMVLVFLGTWFSIYSNFSGIADFLIGSIQFALAQSEALSLPSENNWILIAMSLVCFFAVPFLLHDKRAYLVYGLILLPYFSFFKYAFGRETHLSLSLFLTLYFYLFLFLLWYLEKIKIASLNAMVLCIFLFGVNSYRMGYMLFSPSVPTAPESWSRDALKNVSASLFLFNSRILNLAEFKQNLKNESLENLSEKKLPDDWMETISSKRIDFYPFELSYAAANKLNWQPRPVIQSYTAFTPYLDRLDEKFFDDSTTAPEFILWHADWGMNSVDTAYTLNDEPQTILSIFNHYKIIKTRPKIFLLQRQPEKKFGNPEPGEHVTSEWGAWIKVPFTKNRGLLRIRLDYKRNMLGSLKKSLYNDNLYFIQYKFKDERIVQHRLKLPNSKIAVWVAPYLEAPLESLVGEAPIEIRFFANEPQYMKPELKLDWEFVPVIQRHL